MSGDAYAQMLARLFAARRGGVKLELGRMRACLSRLGFPDRAPRLRVQIAGTNGKGSTVAFARAILSEAGLRVGAFTSPHLNQLAERFSVAGELATRAQVLAAEARVRGAQDLAEPLTFFEQVTAIALCVFEQARVDVALLEVGLGGRYDSTSAVECEVAAVTGVAMDHQDYLGESLEAIASEKAAIFRAGQEAIIGAAGRATAVPWLVEAARVAGTRSITVVDASAMEHVSRWGALGIRGAIQQRNAACAVAIAERAAERLGVSLSDSDVAAGLAGARLAGRLDQVRAAPDVILDGAHNPHAARALAEELGRVAPGGYVLVLGVSAGKDLAGLVAPLVVGAQAVIVTRSDNPRAVACEELAEAARAAGAKAVEAIAPPDRAIARAIARAGAAGVVVVTGSLFLIGEARRCLCGDRVDPVPVSDPV